MKKNVIIALHAGVALIAVPAFAQSAEQSNPTVPSQTPVQTAGTQADTAAAVGAPADDIVVTGNANREGQRKLDASYSITTASAQQIRDANPTSTADILKIVPGIWVETSGGSNAANVFIRGFPTSGDAPFITVAMNGSPIIQPSSLSFLDTTSVFRLDDTVERVEVLRGGPSPIFGNGQPGATTNFILKDGTSQPELSLRATYGTEGQYRGDAVASGPIGNDTTYMIGGFYRYSKGLRPTGFPVDLGGQVTASVKHDFGAGDLKVYARYLDDHNVVYTPMPLQITGNGKFSTLPGFDARTDVLVGPEIENTQIETGPGVNGGPTQKKNVDLSNGRNSRIYTIGSVFHYDLGFVQVQNNVNYTRGNVNTYALFTGANPQTVDQYLASAGGTGTVTYHDSGARLSGDQETIQAGIWAAEKQIRSFTDELKLSRKLFEGNTLTLGGYYAHVNVHDQWNLGNSVLLALEPQARVLDATLDNGTILTRDGFTSGSFYVVNARYRSDNIAGYLSDEWKIGALRLDGGLRVEHVKLAGTLENSSAGDLDGNPLTAYNNGAAYLNGTFTDVRYDKTQLSWTAGADYAFTDRLNGFVRANYGALLPQFDDLRGNLGALQNVKPQTVRQYEVGLKTATRFYDLYVTAFYNRFRNLIFQQLVNGENLVRFGGSRGYGIEFEGAVRPVARVQIAARGVWQDAKFKDFGDNTGNVVARQPKFLIAVIPSYTMPTAWGKVRVFGTYTHVGNRFADVENLQPLGSYDTLDLGAAIDLNDRFSIQATVDNATNTLALTEGNIRVIGAGDTNGYFLGRPIFGRHATITAAYKF